jgi:hypothetical protein
MNYVRDKIFLIVKVLDALLSVFALIMTWIIVVVGTIFGVIYLIKLVV